MKEKSNIIDITALLEYKRQFEWAECPYLVIEGAEYSADYHFNKIQGAEASASWKEPIPIFTGASEARKLRVMKLIEKGKQCSP